MTPTVQLAAHRSSMTPSVQLATHRSSMTPTVQLAAHRSSMTPTVQLAAHRSSMTHHHLYGMRDLLRRAYRRVQCRVCFTCQTKSIEHSC